MQYLDLTLPDIAANLALDEALLIAAEERGTGPVLRVWEFPAFAVVLGASRRWREDVHVEACRADRVAIARRSTGGGTVVLGPGALNVAVVLEAGSAPGLRSVDTAQRIVLERFAAAIREQEPRVEVLGSGDLTMAGRKFAGSAQRRLRDHFLVHASILYDFPLDRISRYLALPSRQPAYREGRSHDDFLGNLAVPRDLLGQTLRSAWPNAEEATQPLSKTQDIVDRLVETKFADQSWVERL
jgi:lipoate-protein ligase A